MEKRKIRLNIQTLKKHNIIALILFGSQVVGKKHPHSDIDVGVIFKKPNTYLKKPVTVYSDLFDQLSPLTISPQQKLDIVYLDEAPISLRFKAIEEGIQLYVADKTVFANYREQTMREYFDFKPVLNEFNQVFLGTV